MSPLAILALFFLLIFAGVLGAGYAMARGKDGGGWTILRKFGAGFLAKTGGAMPAGLQRPSELERKLRLAGYRRPDVFRQFQGVKIAVALVMALALSIVNLAQGEWTLALVAGAAAAGGGYLAPDLVLNWLIRRRSGRLLAGIPSAVDLMVLSLEAGQALETTLAETARELRDVYPDLSAEFAICAKALSAGQSRPEVWADLRERNREPELSRLAQVLLESGRFGTSLAPALRSHARYLRIRLRQEAYGQARKVGVKLIFPVFFLIFPSIVVVTLGPAFLRITAGLARMNGP